MNLIHLDHHRRTREIAETLRDHVPEIARLAGVDRYDSQGADPDFRAAVWSAHGFDDDDARRWLEAGVVDPDSAARLREAGVDASDHGWSIEVAGQPLGVALSIGDITVGECLSYLERGELYRAEVLP